MHVSKWKILVRNKTIISTIVIKETNVHGSNKEKSVCGQFLLNGSNGITRGKLFFILFSGGCFTEVAIFFKSYREHYNNHKSTYFFGIVETLRFPFDYITQHFICCTSWPIQVHLLQGVNIPTHPATPCACPYAIATSVL